MPRRPAEASAEGEEPSRPAEKKGWSIASLSTAAKLLAKRREQADAAAAWCLEEGVGAKAAVSSKKFGDVTYNMIQPRLSKLKSGAPPSVRDHAKQILTNSERRKLAEWLIACCDGQMPKDRTEITAKVKEMLRARHASNKKKKWGPGTVRLNAQELGVLDSNEPRLSNQFFQRYYPWCRAHGIEIEEGVDRSQDATRSSKMTEAVVERHFHGEFGLEAELCAAAP